MVEKKAVSSKKRKPTGKKNGNRKSGNSFQGQTIKYIAGAAVIVVLAVILIFSVKG